ncbi:hypothetical protein [Ruegeria atlantica]|uniref:Periplasmic glucans biosynthesis protein n=1 Tax=Ruegeria atlantica TaxID=81569 RepID=A0A0P1EXH3_9RHOB|nr:hypothetical protein [Ruegeria atlantica]CUH47335.1 Periplasmic glucans biosynthesis protein [Ruegeria atlantica]
MPKPDTNPMYLVELMNAAPRCTATSKRTGERCKGPAVRGWTVCRLHGARGGAPEGDRHGNYRHGGRTQEAQAIRKLAMLMRRTLP